MQISSSNNNVLSFGKIIGVDSLPANVQNVFCKNPEFENLAKIWEEQGQDMLVKYTAPNGIGINSERLEISNGKDFSCMLYNDKDKNNLLTKIKNFSFESLSDLISGNEIHVEKPKKTFIQRITGIIGLIK